MIERYVPVGQHMGLGRAVDRLLEHAFTLLDQSESPPMNTLAVNVYEDDDNVVVEALVPGAATEDIEVRVEGNTLTILVVPPAEGDRTGRNYLLQEQASGARSRSLQLPETIDPDTVDATLENGQLRVTAPRSRPRRRRIGIGARDRHAEVGDEFRTGERAPPSGVYEYVRLTTDSDCTPTDEERRVPVSRGEPLPPIRSCRSGAIWRLVARA